MRSNISIGSLGRRPAAAPNSSPRALASSWSRLNAWRRVMESAILEAKTRQQSVEDARRLQRESNRRTVRVRSVFRPDRASR
ncbi:hypothetical protein G6F62_015814 [Rhizopus arrhizus]|nr:hypothetical protein G6F62_015814 [Rhizopus arrhizus]